MASSCLHSSWLLFYWPRVGNILYCSHDGAFISLCCCLCIARCVVKRNGFGHTWSNWRIALSGNFSLSSWITLYGRIFIKEFCNGLTSSTRQRRGFCWLRSAHSCFSFRSLRGIAEGLPAEHHAVAYFRWECSSGKRPGFKGRISIASTLSDLPSTHSSWSFRLGESQFSWSKMS